MAKWSTTVTNKGIALQSKQVRGATLSFTRVVGGSGTVSLVNLKEQTAVSNIKQTISVESILMQDAKYTITVLLSNSDIDTGYNLSQIGFYATDPDEGEILFAIAQADTPESVPSKTDAEGFCLEFAFTFKNSNEANVEIVPDMAGYVTRQAVEDIVTESSKECKADGIATGNPITIVDSTNAPLNDITVYGASKQEVTNGYQLFDASKISTASKGGATVTNNGDGSFTVSGSGTLTDSFETRYYLKPEEFIELFKPGMLKFKSESVTYPFVYINLYKDNVFHSTILSNKHTTPTSAELKEEYFDGTYSLYIGFNGAANDLSIKGGTIKPMLYQDGDGTWESFTGSIPGPNPDYPLPIESVGDDGNVEISLYAKNLFKNTMTTGTAAGIKRTLNDDGSFIMNGTATENHGVGVGQSTFPDGEYILSGGTTDAPLPIWGSKVSTGEWEQIVTDYGDGVLFTADKSVYSKYLLQYHITTGKTFNNQTFYPMVRPAKCNDATWESYKKTTVAVPLTEPLYGIPVSRGGNYIDASGQRWICDEIDLARGVYIKRIKKVTIDSSYTWHIEHHSTYTPFWTALHEAKRYEPRYGRILCTKYIDSEEAYYNLSNMHCSLYTPHNLTDNAGKNWLYIRDDSFADASEINAYFAENTMDIYFELAEPVVTPLTEEQRTALANLQTFESTTNIFADDMASMEVDYFKNTDNGKAMAILKKENNELRAMLGDVNKVLEQLIGGA